MNKIKKVLSCIIIFSCGYILGQLDKYRIFLNIKGGFEQLDTVGKISFVSSLITVVLFIFFIVSKLIIINTMKETIYEEAEVIYSDEKEDLKIIEEYDLGDKNSEKVYIYSSKFLRSIKIYEYDICKLKKKGKPIKIYKNLRSGLAIQINTSLPCGIPRYIVEYIREDYMKGTLLLGENGKSGVLSELINVKHTLKSFIYYIVM